MPEKRATGLYGHYGDVATRADAEYFRTLAPPATIPYAVSVFSLIRATSGGDNFTTHIDEDALELYALGRITDEEQLAPIEEHLLVCAGCRIDCARWIRFCGLCGQH